MQEISIFGIQCFISFNKNSKYKRQMLQSGYPSGGFGTEPQNKTFFIANC